MIVKTLILEVYIPSSNSLKSKRRIIKSITQRCRQKFNVSISEIADMDEYKHSTIGIVTITNNYAYADKILDQCLNLIEVEYDLNIINIEREQR